jgi:DNA polymerase-3 subunit epsilon
MVGMIFQRKNKKAGPAFWDRYLEDWEGKPSRKSQLKDLDWIVLDTETSGLNPKKDRLLSIGALRVRNRKIFVSDAIDLRLGYQTNEPGEAIEVHGLLPGENPDQLDERHALERLLPFLGSCPLVGHHIRFDLSVLDAALLRAGGGRLKNPYVDTASMARRVDSGSVEAIPSALSLDALCHSYGIPPFDRHTAAGDAFLTARVWIRQLSQLEERGVRTWGQLQKRGVFRL